MTQIPENDTIPVVTSTQSDLRGDESTITELKVQELSGNLKTFLSNLDKVMAQMNTKVGGFEVDEMEIYVEISAEGKISLLGTGVQSSAMGGVKLILRRPPNAK
ncbi:MAG: hypothetical protein AAFN65_10800 [Bacteroidota bacterium]